MELQQFLAHAAVAYLLHYNALGALERKDGGTAPGETMYRLAQSESGGARKPQANGRGAAYTVFPVESLTDPNATRVLLGCDERCDVVISDASVSREHAWIDVNGGVCEVSDAGSTAGTFVGGEVISPSGKRALASGVRLTLGTVDLQFLGAKEFYAFVRGFLGS